MILANLQKLKNCTDENVENILMENPDIIYDTLETTRLYKKFEKDFEYHMSFDDEGWLNGLFHYFAGTDEQWKAFSKWTDKVIAFVKTRMIELTPENIHYIAKKNGKKWNGSTDESILEEVLDSLLPDYIRVGIIDDVIIMFSKKYLDETLANMDENLKDGITHKNMTRNFSDESEAYVEHYYSEINEIYEQTCIGLFSDYMCEKGTDYILEQFYKKEGSKYIYVEYVGGEDLASLLIVPKHTNINMAIEELENSDTVFAWATFKGGESRLKDSDLALLKKIGVASYAGVSARLYSEKELIDFNATLEEIEITKKLIKLV